MKNRIEYIIFTSFSYFFRILGLKLSRKFSSILAFVFFNFIPIRKKTTIDNLSKAFPDYSKDKINKIAYGCYKSFSISLIEILYSPWMSKQQIENAINCSNVDFILENYNKQKGLILLSAHFGNWEYMALSIGAQVKLPLYVVVKSQRNPFVTDWLNNIRTKWGNKIITLGVSIRQVYKELKDKNIIAMVADQRGPSDGIRVSFMGMPTTVYPGPAVLSLKTQAPLLYGIPVRQPDNSYKTDFFEISSENLPEDHEEKVIELNQRMFNHLEKFVRANPEQWLWMHKRWKY